MTREPVRIYLYSVLAPLLALLAAYGIVSEEFVVLWITLGGAILGVGGVESARARVTPVAQRSQS